MPRPVTEEDVWRRIAQAFPGTGKNALGLPLDDDAALLTSRAGQQTLLTCDWFLEGTHFLRDRHPADAVGWKCLARATSDIVAMGGAPRCFLLSLALPGSHCGPWLRGFFEGLQRAAAAFACNLAGGDTTRRDEILISVTVVGEVPSGKAIRRSGARAGDQVFVSGTLGEAELGLRMMQKHRGFAQPKNAALKKHLYPEPPLALGQWLLRNKLASAMMDLSDGLSSDLPRLARASGVGAKIVAAQLPIPRLADRAEGISLALHGGDDYELLFSVRPAVARRLPETYLGRALTRIGEITARKKIVVEMAGTVKPLPPGGWDPFRK